MDLFEKFYNFLGHDVILQKFRANYNFRKLAA